MNFNPHDESSFQGPNDTQFLYSTDLSSTTSISASLADDVTQIPIPEESGTLTNMQILGQLYIYYQN